MLSVFLCHIKNDCLSISIDSAKVHVRINVYFAWNEASRFRHALAHTQKYKESKKKQNNEVTFLNKNTWWQQNMFFCWIRFLKKIHSNRFWYIEVNDPNVTICFLSHEYCNFACKFVYSTAHYICSGQRSQSVRKCAFLQSFWHNSLTLFEHFGCSFSSLTFSSITSSNILDTDGNSSE